MAGLLIAIGNYVANNVIAPIVSVFQWGTSTPTKVWGTPTSETWG